MAEVREVVRAGVALAGAKGAGAVGVEATEAAATAATSMSTSTTKDRHREVAKEAAGVAVAQAAAATPCDS
jgi:hypothetical protein